MQHKVYFIFFIFCAILSQGIVAKFLEEDVGELSERLVRQKRVIDRRPGKGMPLRNGDFPFIATLKKRNVVHCVVNILSQHTAITAAQCVESPDIWTYTVHSGTTYTYRGNEHNVTEKNMHGHNPSRSSIILTGIALITVNPSFEFSSTTGSISLHSAPVLEDMKGIVAGWGFRNNIGEIETQQAYKTRLRKISVPIMNHRECVNIYSGHFPITDEDICTYHSQKLCAENDAGAPLIIDNQLAGIHIGGIFTRQILPIKPDVFVLLQHFNYGPWIRRNIVH